MGRLRKHARMLVQLAFTALTNGYAAGFAKGSIYKGPGKFICLPGLNCYSCPGALGSCPIGSLQAVIGSRSYRFSFYIAGFLLLFGALFGRLVCGWLCPFGLVQDLLYKIPFVKKLRRLPGDRWLKYLKYVILAGFVIVLPLTVLDIVGQGQPWFCKYICPSGTLFAGIPLIASNPPLRAALGWLFTWKAAILAALLLLSLWYTGRSAVISARSAPYTGCSIRPRSTGSALTRKNARAAVRAKRRVSWISRSTRRPTVRNASAAGTAGAPVRTALSAPQTGARPDLSGKRGRDRSHPVFSGRHYFLQFLSDFSLSSVGQMCYNTKAIKNYRGYFCDCCIRHSNHCRRS